MTVQRSVELTVKLVDQVSATAKQMQASADEAKESVVSLEHAQDSVNINIESTRKSLDDVVTDARSTQTETSRIVQSIQDVVDSVEVHTPDVDSSIAKVRTDLDGVSSKAKSTATQVKTSMAEADESIIATQTRQALELATLMGIKESVGSVISGVTQLGLVSDETAKDLAKVNAGFQLVAGAATGLKTLQVLMTALNTQTAINASLNTFLSVIRKPAIGSAIVGLGLGAMAGVAGMYLYTSNNSSKNVTVNVTDTASETTKGEIFRVVNGGAV